MVSNSPSHVADAIRRIANDFIDDAILGVSFEVHRAHKVGLLEAELGDVADENKYRQVNETGLDIFGQTPIKKSHECICPNCKRNLAASRFAPHLEKCMGMGRNSSRIASRRIQNTSREGTSGGISLGAASDDDADDDWIVDRKKRKRDKNSPRRSRKINTKSTDGVSWSVIIGGTDSEKRAMLSNMCGVVSEHTRKMCTRSMKCPQHTNNQRRAVREQLLGNLMSSSLAEEGVSSTTAVSSSSVPEPGVVVVDVLDDNTSNSAVSSSWDHELSNQNSSSTSPADSTSTTLSSLSSHSSVNNGTAVPISTSQASSYTSYFSDNSNNSKSTSGSTSAKSKSDRSNKNKKKSSKNSKSSHSSDK